MKLSITTLTYAISQTALAFGERVVDSVLKNKIKVVSLLALGCLAVYLCKRINNHQLAQLAAKTSRSIDADQIEESPLAKTHHVFQEVFSPDARLQESEPVEIHNDLEESKENLPKLPSPPPSPLPNAEEIEPEILVEKDILPDPSPVSPLPKEDDKEKSLPQVVKIPENLKQDDLNYPQENRRYLAELKTYLEAECDPTLPEIEIQGDVLFGYLTYDQLSSDNLKQVFLLLEKRAKAGGSVILHFDNLRPQMQSVAHPEFSVPSWVTRLVIEECEGKLDFKAASSLRSLEIVFLKCGLNLSDAVRLEDAVIFMFYRENTDRIILSPSLKKFTLYTYDYHFVFEKSLLPFFDPIDFTQAKILEFLKFGAQHADVTYKLPASIKDIQMHPFVFSADRHGVWDNYRVMVDASDCQGLSQASIADLEKAKSNQAIIIFPCSPEEYQKRLELARLKKEEEEHTLTVGDGSFFREDLDLSQFTCLGNEPVWNLTLYGGLGHPKKHIEIKIPSTLKALIGSAILNADLDFSQATNLTKLEFTEVRKGNIVKIPPSVTHLMIKEITGTLDLSEATGLSKDMIDTLRDIAQKSNGIIIE